MEKNNKVFPAKSTAILVVAVIVLILTAAIVTPLAAFAYSLRVPGSFGTDDAPSVISAADRNANTPHGESIARVKPPTDQVSASAGPGTAK